MRVTSALDPRPNWFITGQPITWTGRGASLALAELIAHIARRCGANAYSTPPEDAAGNVGWVSRSGVIEGAAELLVTERPGTGRRVIITAEEHERAWFPIGWQFAVVRELSACLDLPLPETGASNDAEVIIVPCGDGPITTLLAAAHAKLGIPQRVVCTPQGFLHGPFARAYVGGGPIHLLGEAPQVTHWAKNIARVPLIVTPLSTPESLAGLAAYAWMLRGLSALTSTSSRPVPVEHDPLYGG